MKSKDDARGLVSRERTDVPVNESWKLAPSDFAFLWEECSRCFYLKVARNHKRPSIPFPGVFSQIDSAMKNFFEGKRTEEVAPELPPGKFAYFGNWVESASIRPPGRSTSAYVRGPFDTVIAFDDGSHALIDFKTAPPKPEQVAKYSRQLHAYAHALERPATGKLNLANVRILGLLCFDPKGFHKESSGEARFTGEMKWLDVPRDDGAFVEFVGEVIDLLSAPAVPPPSETCAWCKYREEIRSSAP